MFRKEYTIASNKKTTNKHKGKKEWIIAAIVASVIIICGIGFGILKLIQKSHDKQSDFELIQYTDGGAGMGTEAMCADITVSINGDRSVKLTNDYDFGYIENYRINPGDYLSLSNYIESHINIFSDEDKSNKDVLDGSSEYILVRTKSGKEYKTGGYAVNDTEFIQMREQILKTAGGNRFEAYADKVHNLD